MFYFKLLTTVLKHASSRNVCILSSNVHDRHTYPLIYFNPFFTFIAWWYLVFLISFSLTFFVFPELAFPVLLFCLLVFYFTVCFPIFIYMWRTSLCFLICLKIMDLFFLFVLSFFCFTYFVLFKLCLNLKQKYGFRVTGVMFRCYYLW